MYWSLAVVTSGLLVLGNCHRAWSQSEKPVNPRTIDTLVRTALQAWDVPGVAVGIVWKGEIVYLKGHGIRSLADSEPVTPDTLFPMASCTKAFTTTVLAMLADEGKLTWDDPVSKHLPSFRLNDPLANREVRLRDLVCHRTGLANHDWLWYREPWPPEEAVRRAGLLPLDRPFRSAFQYQSTMFTAAGLAAARVAGVPWQELVRKRILEPLRMKRTVFTSSAAHELEPAVGHRFNARGQVETMPLCPMENPDPAGSIHSCARDLCRWLLFHLAEGKPLVSARALGETHKPQMVIPMDERTRRMHPETVQMSYGMAWVIQDYRGLELQSHAGLIDGFRVHLTLAPREGLGIVLLNNMNQTQMNLALSNTLVDALLAKPRRDWHRLLHDVLQADAAREFERTQAREKQRQGNAPPSVPLADYVGKYSHPAFGEAEVKREGNELVLRWNRIGGPLEHYQYDSFIIRAHPLDGTQIHFQMGKDGKVASLRLDEPALKFEMRRLSPESGR